MAFWLEAPGATEIIERRPLVGRSGQDWESRYLVPLGIDRDKLLITNTLRCNPPQNVYPTSWLKRQSEELCRQYDTGIKIFDPNLWIVTYHPAAALRIPVYSRFIYRDIEKGLDFTHRGYRVCIVMGEKALQLLKQSSKPSLTNWHGHFWNGEYPFHNLTQLTEEEYEAGRKYE